MKVLFITGLYPQEHIETLRDFANGCIQNAPNVFQWAVVEGLHKNNVDYKVLSFPFLPSYPFNFKKRNTPFCNITFNSNIVGEMVSYCDSLLFKTISIRKKCEKKVLEWIKSNYTTNDKLVILTYSSYPPFLQALKKVKSIYPNIIIASIITDLVDNMMDYRSNRSFFKRLQCYKVLVETKSLYKYIDKYILLSAPMIERIQEATDKHIVIEGISAQKQYFKTKKSDAFLSILYTGTLEEFSGVGDLVNAFLKIKNPNIRLIICGAGQLENVINEAANKDDRIIFNGLVSREEALYYQKNATVLINPRKPDGEITRFSFPSKTMEYLSSGTPMIGYRLDGIPSEYYNYYYTVDDMSEQSLINKIESVLSLPIYELDAKAYDAFNFIMNNKTAEVQVRKIINFIENA